jgi:hypothetical protein
MDRRWGNGEIVGDSARCLRAHRRPRAFRGGRRVLHPEKAPCCGDMAGKSPVDLEVKQGIKHSTIVDANGILLGAKAALANRQNSPLLDGTLDTLEVVGSLPERMSVHLDRGYDSETTRQKLKARGLIPMISGKGKPAPLAATKRWVVHTGNSTHW